MNISKELNERAESKCELCSISTDLTEYIVPPKSGTQISNMIAVCNQCEVQLSNSETVTHYWQCLNESIWSTVPAVQVVSYRLLKKLDTNPWAQDLMNMVDLDPTVIEWAEDDFNPATDLLKVHRDSNGVELKQGDTVTLIQDLNVKGANFTAKRGTSVKRITLVQDNPEHIEGRVNDQQIVILAKYVKKSS